MRRLLNILNLISQFIRVKTLSSAPIQLATRQTLSEALFIPCQLTGERLRYAATDSAHP